MIDASIKNGFRDKRKNTKNFVAFDLDGGHFGERSINKPHKFALRTYFYLFPPLPSSPFLSLFPTNLCECGSCTCKKPRWRKNWYVNLFFIFINKTAWTSVIILYMKHQLTCFTFACSSEPGDTIWRNYRKLCSPRAWVDEELGEILISQLSFIYNYWTRFSRSSCKQTPSDSRKSFRNWSFGFY